jgi:aminoglycoside phosphotransferase (APT) family kinase protein
VFIPTASVAEPGDHGWFVADLSRLHGFGWREFDVLELNGLPHQMVLDRLLHADVVGTPQTLHAQGARFAGATRGGDLQSRDTWMGTCFEESVDLLDVPLLRGLWARLRKLPRRNPDLMCHGDLIPGNILVSSGRLAPLDRICAQADRLG